MAEIRPTILEVPPDKITDYLEDIQGLVRWLHLDVGDGQFVPRKNNFTPIFLHQLKKEFDLAIDVHLMVKNPIQYISDYVKVGADLISFHLESDNRPAEVLAEIKKQGAQACLAIKLETEVSLSKGYWGGLDEILIMGVNPGFGGQEFDERALVNIKKLRELGFGGKIKVDGGVRVGLAKELVANGADILVAGTALFGHGNIKENYQALLDDLKGGIRE